MLTERELEEWEEVNSWHPHPAITALLADVRELRGLLKQLEWCVLLHTANYYEHWNLCPVCSSRDRDGHKIDCWIKAALEG